MPKTPLKVATPSKENKKLQYSNLISHIGLLLEQAKSHFIKQVNTTMTEMYRNIGKYIVEYEQKGEDKAEYGSGLLKKLSTDLTQQFGKGYSYYNLNFMRNAYLAFPIFETLSQKSNALSWSHIVFLCQIKDEFERNFYLIEASHEQRSLRELKRQFNSALYERLALSKDKNKVMKLASEGQIITTPSEVLKDPYIFEFLGRDEKTEYTESQLEQAIIDNLEIFLLELGKGFTFVGRQKRFTAGEEHFYVDLVFYHRFLRCFLLVDLKIGKISYQDIGQMQMYVNRYDKEYKAPEENKTIGLILCKVKNDIILEYTLPSEQETIFAKEYKLYLPDKKAIKAYLDTHLHIEETEKTKK